MTIAPIPIDYNLHRKQIANAVQLATGCVCALEDPVVQQADRPSLPYFSFNITTPGKKYGPDSRRWIEADSQFETSGVRRMSVSFHCYAVQKEDAWGLMSLWQSSLESATTQAFLRAEGIAVWQVQDVKDLSALLNTGWEGRAQLDVTMGISSVLKVPSETQTIDKVGISGQVQADGKTVPVPEFDVGPVT